MTITSDNNWPACTTWLRFPCRLFEESAVLPAKVPAKLDATEAAGVDSVWAVQETKSVKRIDAYRTGEHGMPSSSKDYDTEIGYWNHLPWFDVNRCDVTRTDVSLLLRCDRMAQAKSFGTWIGYTVHVVKSSSVHGQAVSTHWVF